MDNVKTMIRDPALSNAVPVKRPTTSSPPPPPRAETDARAPVPLEQVSDTFAAPRAAPTAIPQGVTATATPSSSDISKAQKAGKTELFDTSGPNPGEPSLSDIHQGAYGDCYVLSSIGALAQEDPNAVRNMIHDNGDGTYTVTFQQRKNNGPFGFDPWDVFGHSYQPVKVTVSAKDIPDDSVDGSKSVGGPVVDSADGKQVIWPEVVEAAFAKLHHGYKQIGGGGWPQPVLEQLTGHDASSSKPSDVSGAALLKDFKSGKLITVCTLESDGGQAGAENGTNPYGLVGGHAYTVTDVYMKNGKEYVTLNNPWGFDQPKDIPFSKLPGVADDIAVGSAN